MTERIARLLVDLVLAGLFLIIVWILLLAIVVAIAIAQAQLMQRSNGPDISTRLQESGAVLGSPDY